MEDLLYRISTQEPDIINLVEIKPKNGDIPDEKELQIDGYMLYLSKGYDKKGTRGVCSYVKSNLKSSQINNEITEKFNDCVWLKIENEDSKPLLIGNIYRSGTPEKAKTLDNDLNVMLKQMALEKEYKDVVITGDFNRGDIEWSQERYSANNPHDIEFIGFLEDSFLQQFVNEPTRIRYNEKTQKEEKSLLDLILANDEHLIGEIEYNSHLGLSDHITLNFTVNHYSANSTDGLNNRSIYQYSKCNFDKMKEMMDLDWPTLLENQNTEDSYEIFLKKYNEAVQKCVPSVKLKENITTKPLWMKHQTEKLVKEKHHLWIRYLNTKQAPDFLAYKTIRNKVSCRIKSDRKDFEQKLAKEVKDNIKAFWKYVNRNRKRKTRIPVLKKKDGSTATSDHEKATTLNEQFSSVFTIEKGDIPNIKKKNITQFLTRINITEEGVLKKLQNLRTDKSPGPDNVHPSVLKNLASILKKPLQIIFQNSLDSKTLPAIWKQGSISPLFKKGNRKLPCNYRPISLTSIVCKILESIIADEISKHLTTNLLRDDNQHGFTVRKSTESNLLEALNIWTDALSHDIPIDIIYLDYEKAFDKVPHQRLVKQLDAYGITSDVLGWISNFLSDRTQQVVINGACSELTPVTSGVPQGSVLGPVLFLIYVSDVSHLLTNFCKLFADDTKLFSRVFDEEQSTSSLQEDVTRLTSWTELMLMKYNLDKCHILHLGKKNPQAKYVIPTTHNLKEKGQSVSYTVFPYDMKAVTEEKDLGVIIDDQLSFKSHIETKVKIANKMLGIVRRTFKYMDSDIFLRLYKSIVRPHLEYASVVWSPTTKQYQDKIESIQRRATRSVPSIAHLSYSERLKSLKLPTLHYRRLRSCMIFLYKYTHGLVKINLNSECEKCNNPNALQPSLGTTRGHNFKFQIQHHPGQRNKFFTARALEIWNRLGSSTVNASSINAFKNRLSADPGMPNQYDYRFSY